MGAITPRPLPTYPDGFPAESWRACAQATGHEFCCNKPYSGTEVIDDFGEHHLATGELILYTSADSVLQIAAHDDVLTRARPPRALRAGPRGDGRRATRSGASSRGPFTGAPGAFERTTGRKDFSVDPPSRTYLDELHADGVPVHAVGKVYDLFAGHGIDRGPQGQDQRAGAGRPPAADGRRSTTAWSSPTWSRPTSSTATATTSRASPPRCARSTPPSAAGARCCAPTTS